jgi:hypothetical protein
MTVRVEFDTDGSQTTRIPFGAHAEICIIRNPDGKIVTDEITPPWDLPRTPLTRAEARQLGMDLLNAAEEPTRL